MMNSSTYERFSRQIVLKEIGEAGQQKILQAKVLVIGAGGLGCPALQYLAAAGVGTIGIADHDSVNLSNLQRQVLFATGDIGKLKTDVASLHLRNINPGIVIETYPRITTTNAIDIISAYDLVIDATDNFATRYLVNDACVLLNKPIIYGAVSRFEGQVAVLNVNDSANYRDFFPDPPAAGEIENCEIAGVLGVLPGIIGTMQAAESIKLITGIGKPLVNSLLIYNLLSHQTYIVTISPERNSRMLIPSSRAEFQQRNYEIDCGPGNKVIEIDGEHFDKLLAEKTVRVVDVREESEEPLITEFVHQRIPLSILDENFASRQQGSIVFICQSGQRSMKAALRQKNHSSILYSLRGGILQWKRSQQENTNP